MIILFPHFLLFSPFFAFSSFMIQFLIYIADFRIRKKSGTPKLNGSVEKLVAEGVDGQQPVVGHQDGNGDRSRYSTEEQRLEKGRTSHHGYLPIKR